MAEYIEREAALSLDLCIGINCQDCPFKMDSFHGASGCKVEDFMKAIPAADVVEVVRCRECNYNRGETSDLWGNPAILCVTAVTHAPDWYCASGKRKDGGPDDV